MRCDFVIVFMCFVLVNSSLIESEEKNDNQTCPSCVCDEHPGCFYSRISTRTFRRALTTSLDSCAEIKIECSFGGVTKSGRVWRKVPESDARSVSLSLRNPLHDGKLCWSSLMNSMFHLVVALGWKSVVIHMDNSTDVKENVCEPLVSRLHSRGVLTMLIRDECLLTPRCLFTSSASNVLVLGSYAFVRETFMKITAGVQQGNVMCAALFSEWMTVIPAEHVQHFNGLVRRFQHLAAISYTPKGDLSLWTVLHVRDDSQLSFVSSLPPPSPSRLTRQRILPNLSRGLGGRTLRVVVKELGSSVFKVNNGSDEIYQGVLIEMLQELSFRLNFSYILIPPPDHSWGQELDNGQWDGPIGMLTRGEADMALAAFTQSYQRSLVADPVTPFMHDNAVIVFRKEGRGSNLGHWAFFLQPFDTLVYEVTGGCMLLMLLLLLLLERCHWSLHAGHQRAPQGTGGLCRRVLRYVELLLAGLVREPFYASPVVSHAGRVLVVTWMLLCLVLASVYSSKLTSSLTVSEQALPFNSLAQLISQNTYTWGLASGTAQEAILRSSQNPEFRAFYRGAKAFAASDPTVLSRDYEVQKHKVFTQRYAYFTATIELFEKWSSQVCGLTLIPETYMTFSVGPFLRKGSPYTRLVSDEISHMVDSGLIDYWRRKWSPEKRQCEPGKGQSGRVIGLSDTQTAFYLAALGLGLAAVTLGSECFVHYLTASTGRVKVSNGERAARNEQNIMHRGALRFSSWT